MPYRLKPTLSAKVLRLRDLVKDCLCRQLRIKTRYCGGTVHSADQDQSNAGIDHINVRKSEDEKSFDSGVWRWTKIASGGA